MNLFKAHLQWKNRPQDETFESIEAMHLACAQYRQQAREATDVPVSSLRVQADDGDIFLVGRKDIPARLTNWAFQQLSQKAGAPPSYLRELPATLAAQNLNHGLSVVQDDSRANLLLHRNNGDFVARALTSDRYERIWNNDVTDRLLQLTQNQPWWTLPKAYNRFKTEQDARDMVPRGAYASDHDMFVFLVDESHPIKVPGQTTPLKRGFFTWNSEVGQSSYGFMTFLYDYVCGNHICWGVSNVNELRVRHIGDANRRAFGQLAVELRRYADSSVSEVEGAIVQARTKLLGQTKDEVLDTILGRRIPELSRKRLDEAYDIAAREERYGDPRSAWGLVNGLTELNGQSKFTDQRVALDRAAGKVLQMSF